MSPSPQPRHGFWADLTTADHDSLLAAGASFTFRPGRALLPQHESSGDIMILWSGYTKIAIRLAIGQHVVLALRGPGDIIGELANLNGGRRSATVAALTAVDALRVPRERFLRLLDQSAVASDALRHTLVDRLREADRDRVAGSSMTVGQRLARFLLKLAERYGVTDSSGAVTVGMLSQKDLAECIGGAPRTVVRQMAVWRDRGIVATTRRSVTIYDPAALARFAGRTAPRP